MVRMEAVFQCGDGMTPDVAAKLTAIAEKYDAKLEMERGGKRVLLDSLIGILSLDCRRGTRLTVLGEGPEAAEAIGVAVEAVKETVEKTVEAAGTAYEAVKESLAAAKEEAEEKKAAEAEETAAETAEETAPEATEETSETKEDQQ